MRRRRSLLLLYGARSLVEKLPLGPVPRQVLPLTSSTSIVWFERRMRKSGR